MPGIRAYGLIGTTGLDFDINFSYQFGTTVRSVRMHTVIRPKQANSNTPEAASQRLLRLRYR